MEPVSNVYCCLCGVVFPTPNVNNRRLPKSERPWFLDVRAVYINRREQTRHLSGAGFMVSRNRLSAQLDSTAPLSSTESQPNEINLNQQHGEFWGYGFHDDCWMLLLAKLSHSRTVDENAIVEEVFRLLSFIECPNFSVFNFGHDYGGVAKDQDPLGRRHSVHRSALGHYNPCWLPSWEELQKQASSILNAKTLDEFTLPSSDTACPIRKLPSEIFYLIAQLLPLRDVANLRLTCQEFALKTTLKSLPQEFWKSRFSPGFELDYVLPGTTVNTSDWLQLFCGIMALRESGYEPLVNKKRIWKILDHFVVTLGAVRSTENYSEHGDRVSLENIFQEKAKIYRLEAGKNEGPDMFFTSEYSLSGLVDHDHNKQLNLGCRLSQFCVSRFEPQVENGQPIEVSTVSVGEKFYISSFRRVSSQTSGQLGSHGEKKLIHIPNHLRIESIEVAFRRSGLAGIRFLCTGNYKSPWVGQIEGHGLGRSVLQVPQNFNKYNLVVGVDALKIVYLAFVETHEDFLAAREYLEEEDIENKPLNTQSLLWYPEYPSHQDITLSSIMPSVPLNSFNPLINMDFGGPGGVWLESLTGLVGHMSTNSSPVGLEFVYSDSSILFGLEGSVKITALINGPAGERIDSIYVITSKRSQDVMVGLRITTNRDRSVDFVPVEFDSPSAQKLIHLPPKYKNLITGFVVAESTHFIGMGLQFQPGRSQRRFIEHRVTRGLDPDKIPREFEHERDVMISQKLARQGTGEFAAYGLLSGVRRIHSSIGVDGNKRVRHHISGFRFDYHDPSDSSVVVGQWLTPKDSFEIAVSEDIVKMTLWYLRTIHIEYSHGHSAIPIGNFSAARFDTSDGRSVTFSGDGVDLELQDDFVQQEFEANFGEKMIAISWVLNQSYDSVRAVMERTIPQTSDESFIPHGVPRFDQYKIYFEVNHLGLRDRLAAVTAHFSRRGESIIGLVFTYESELKRSIGYTSDLEHQTIELEGKINRVTVLQGARKLRSLEFQTTRQPQVGPPEIFTKTLKGKEPHNPRIQYSQWLLDGRSNTVTNKLGSLRDIENEDDHIDHAYPVPPADVLVGIYLHSIAIDQIGGIFSRWRYGELAITNAG